MIDYTHYKNKTLKKRKEHPSFIEQEIINRLLDKLSFIHIKPARILCINPPYAALIEPLQQQFEQATIYTCDLSSTNIAKQASYHVPCDIDQGLPFTANQFDLVLSNLTLHKLEHTEHFIHEIKRVLNTDGMCLFSLFGVETLQEIAYAWHQVDHYPHVHPFYDMHDIGDCALKAGFDNPVLDTESIQLTYTNADKALDDIRAMSDPLSDDQMRRSLTGKLKWQQFLSCLSLPLKQGKALSITYEIIYGHMIKQQQNQAKLTDNQAKVSLASLKQTLKS